MTAHDKEAKAKVDTEVLVPTISIVAEQIQSLFKDKLCSLFPEAELLENPSMLDRFAAEQMLVAVGPAKAPPRMQEKVRNAARSSDFCLSAFCSPCSPPSMPPSAVHSSAHGGLNDMHSYSVHPNAHTSAERS